MARTEKKIIAESPQMKKILQMIEYIKDVDSSVLITGESGTGKEVIFNYICQTSCRKDQPVIKINCGAIPENLFESELFGYEDGAFTGARKKGKIGLLEKANHGTLFLDEISEISMEMQVKLLRALQEKEIFHVGGTESIPVDVRIVSATNQNLEQMVEDGKFRRDLYYRLNVVHLEIPPLRERQEDILPLCYHFLDVFNAKYHKNKGLTVRAAKTLSHLDWPGNIRELRNVLIRALSLCSGNQITLTDLPPELRQQAIAEPAGTDGKLQSVVKNSEAQTILLALGDHHWNVAKTARALGISRASMYEKMRKFGIRRPPSGF